jgi:hypothetical protein
VDETQAPGLAAFENPGAGQSAIFALGNHGHLGNDRNAEIQGHQVLDHLDAGQLHCDLDLDARALDRSIDHVAGPTPRIEQQQGETEQLLGPQPCSLCEGVARSKDGDVFPAHQRSRDKLGVGAGQGDETEVYFVCEDLALGHRRRPVRKAQLDSRIALAECGQYRGQDVAGIRIARAQG